MGIFGEHILTELPVDELMSDEVLDDSHYGGDENMSAASEAVVELVAPAMDTKKKGKFGLAEFEFTNEGEVSQCPSVHVPVKNKINKKKGRQAGCGLQLRHLLKLQRQRRQIDPINGTIIQLKGTVVCQVNFP